MFPLFKSEVKTYHTLFHKERKKAFEGLAFLTSIANEISSDALSCSDELELTGKLKMLKRFSHIFEEFNHDVELAMSQFDKRMVEVGKGSASSVERDHPLIGVPSRIPRADLSTYKIGDRGKCAISYIKSIENDLCFIVDLNRTCNTDFRDHVIAHYDGLPDIGTVFAISIENKFFRAIRTHSESTLVSYQVTLIDIGETIAMPLYRSEKYQLSPDASRLPPMAILCLVEKADGLPTNCLQRLLGAKHFDFHITNICSNMLQVELFTEDDNKVKQIENLMSTMSSTSISQPTTPSLGRRSIWDNFPGGFDQSSMSQPATPSLQRRNNISAPNPRDTNPFRTIQMDNNRNVSDRSPSKGNFGPKSPYLMEKNNNQQSDWFTSKMQRNIVNRLPSETTSKDSYPSKMNNFDEMPIKSGMPTSACPKEETNGSCQTGAHPKNGQTSEQNGNGHSTNEKECSTQMMVGQEIAVVPSAVISCDEIYLQLSASANQFAELQRNLNHSVQIRNVTNLPSVGDYVLARYEVDGLIYRAQVTRFIDRHNLLVLYVDYGNTERVTLDSVFEWDPICDTLAFQALKFTLANVKVKEGAECEVKDFLSQKILNKSMKATVTTTVANRIMVRLTDKDGCDIAEQLFAKNFTHKPV